MRGAGLLCAVLLSGCASTGDPSEAAQRRPATPTRTAAVVASGRGVALDEAPPQRRFRLVWIPGAGGPRLRVIEDSDVMALPAQGTETRVPEPPAAEEPRDPGKPPPVIEIPAPR